MDLFKSQYDLIRRTREGLFGYCEQLSQTDYMKEMENFAGDSIISLHAHVADCYQTWLGVRALGKTLSPVDPASIHSVQEMREIFSKTDDIVHEFLNAYHDNWEQKVEVSFKDGFSAEITPLWLFTHTTTHEFHHKGQIVKIGRQLGYAPPDTDLIEYWAEHEIK